MVDRPTVTGRRAATAREEIESYYTRRTVLVHGVVEERRGPGDIGVAALR